MYRKSVMIGNVVIPSDTSRDRYIAYALRSNTICVMTNDGDFIKNCPIASSYCGYNDGWFTAMEFPPNDTTLGTQVVLLNIRKHDIPVVVGCLNPRDSNTPLSEEYQFNVSKEYQETDDKGNILKTGSVMIDGRGLSGVLNMLVGSSEADGGKINITSRNGHELGEINLNTNNFSIFGTKTVGISAGETLTVQVEFLDGEEVKAHKVEISQETILLEHNEGKKITISEEDVVINDGEFGGLIKINDLLGKINALEEKANTHVHIGNTGAPTTVATTQLVPTELKEIENTDAKH